MVEDHSFSSDIELDVTEMLHSKIGTCTYKYCCNSAKRCSI